MKTLLMPVDFSSTSDNSVDFAIEWSKAYEYKHIILLNTLYNSVFDTIIPSEGFVHVSHDYMAKDREDATLRLEELCKKITTYASPDIKVSYTVTELPLLRGI